jgi:hypothetical protein
VKCCRETGFDPVEVDVGVHRGVFPCESKRRRSARGSPAPITYDRLRAVVFLSGFDKTYLNHRVHGVHRVFKSPG